MSAEVIRTAVVIIVTAVLVTALRNRLGEYAIVLSVVATVVILISILENLFGAMVSFNNLFVKIENAGVYFTTALKALGISYITAFAADICRDFGLSALAQTAEIVGKIAIFVLSIPLMTAVLEASLKFVGQ